MAGHCSEIDVLIKIHKSNKDQFISLIKEYGSRNYQWYILGFDKLKTFEEIMEFLTYKFKEENDYLIINKYFGIKLSNDEKFWTHCSSVIDSGNFILYGQTNNDVVCHLVFSNGKIVSK